MSKYRMHSYCMYYVIVNTQYWMRNLLIMARASNLTTGSGTSQPMKKGRVRYLALANEMIDTDVPLSTITDVQTYQKDTRDPVISTHQFFFLKENASSKMA